MSYEFEFNSERRNGSGIFSYFTSGEALSAKDTVYLHTDGLVYKTDASDSAKMPALGIALSHAGIGQRLRLLLNGFIGDESWAWTVGNILYISETVPGTLTAVAPVAPNVIQIVGQAKEADLIIFNSDLGSGGTAGTTIIVRENEGADIGTQPRLNFDDTATIAWNITDDPANTEIDIEAEASINVSRNSAAAVGARPTLNFIEGANITLIVADDVPGDEIDITISSSAVGGTIVIRKNSGADVGTRPRLNFIEGANIALTVLDDGVGNEIDITVAVSGIAAHATSHEPTGSDEVNDIDILNTGTLLSAHAGRHENGGADEISVLNLSGLLADGQTPLSHDTTHEPGGADEVGDIDILNTGTLLSAHKSRHVAAGADGFVGGDLLDATARVGVSKNSGADVGARRSLNFIEGANITFTIADDGGNEEIDITIAASGGGGSGVLSGYYKASNPNGNIGKHPSMIMVDGNSVLIREGFKIPADISTITVADLIVSCESTGNLRWSVETEFGAPCTEDYDTHNDSMAIQTTAVTAKQLKCLDIRNALTGAVGGDLIGLEFTRAGADVLDTLSDVLHFIGINIEGT